MDRDTTIGLYIGLATYAFWGFVPAYFKWLDHVPALSVIAHRIIWAALLLAIFLAIRDRRAVLDRLRLPGRRIAMLCVSGALVATNWLIFVWAVADGQILATSLGYFINPLVNVVLGVLFLGERLRSVQWLAVTIATAATLYLALFIGQPPWLALGLAFSFGFYGLVRKQLPVGPMVGLMWETALLLPIALAYLLWLAPQPGHPAPAGAATTALLVGAGLITLLPLIGFNYAAKRLPLTVVGFLQYLAPSISFCLAVFVYREPFTSERLVAFSGIWLALIVFTGSSLHHERRRRRELIRAEAAIGPPNREL